MGVEEGAQGVARGEARRRVDRGMGVERGRKNWRYECVKGESIK